MTTHKSKHMYLKCGPRTVGRDFIGFEFLITEGLSKGPFFKKSTLFLEKTLTYHIEYQSLDAIENIQELPNTLASVDATLFLDASIHTCLQGPE